MSAELDAEKAAARQTMRAQRALIADPEAGLALIAKFPPELARISPAAGYWPVGSEIDPRPLLAVLARAGAVIVLPRMLAREGPAQFFAWREGEALSADAFGVPAPPPREPALEPRLILAPLLAFDRAGGRLGQGGGHYDRIIARARAAGAIAVGLAYAAQEMSPAPTAPHDAALDWVITEREAIRCAP